MVGLGYTTADVTIALQGCCTYYQADQAVRALPHILQQVGRHNYNHPDHFPRPEIPANISVKLVALESVVNINTSTMQFVDDVSCTPRHLESMKPTERTMMFVNSGGTGLLKGIKVRARGSSVLGRGGVHSLSVPSGLLPSRLGVLVDSCEPLLQSCVAKYTNQAKLLCKPLRDNFWKVPFLVQELLRLRRLEPSAFFAVAAVAVIDRVGFVLPSVSLTHNLALKDLLGMSRVSLGAGGRSRLILQLAVTERLSTQVVLTVAMGRGRALCTTPV